MDTESNQIKSDRRDLPAAGSDAAELVAMEDGCKSELSIQSTPICEKWDESGGCYSREPSAKLAHRKDALFFAKFENCHEDYESVR